MKGSTKYIDDVRQERVDTNRPDRSVIKPIRQSAITSPSVDVFDTQEYFREQNVSLGHGTFTVITPITLKNGDAIRFDHMLFTEYAVIDERNL